MALEQVIKEREEQQPEDMADEEVDLEIAVLLGEKLLQQGGLDVIERALKSSSDPAQVIGQFLMQLGQQMMEAMPDNIQLSPNILLSKGGWVEQMSDFIKEKLGVKEAVMDKAEVYVASTAQQMAQAKQAPQPPQQPQQVQTPPPMPMMGGQNGP